MSISRSETYCSCAHACHHLQPPDIIVIIMIIIAIFVINIIIIVISVIIVIVIVVVDFEEFALQNEYMDYVEFGFLT